MINDDRRDAQRKYNAKYYAKRRREREKAREHRIHVSLRLPEQLVAIVQTMIIETVAHGKYGYRSFSQAVEDLLHKGIEWWAQHPDDDGAIENRLAAVRVSAQIDNISRQRRQAQIIVHRLREEVAEMQGAGNNQIIALQFYKATMDEVLKMPPTIWRDYAIKELEKEFPKFAKTKKVPAMVLSIHNGRKQH